MFSNYRIVTFSPAGRERNMKLLHRYLMSFRHIVDSHEWWVNTPNENDQRAIHEITALSPDFYRAVEVEMPYGRFRASRNFRTIARVLSATLLRYRHHLYQAR